MDKQQFIQTELQAHGKYLQELFVEAVLQKRLMATKDLINSLQSSPFSVNTDMLRFNF